MMWHESNDFILGGYLTHFPLSRLCRATRWHRLQSRTCVPRHQVMAVYYIFLLFNQGGILSRSKEYKIWGISIISSFFNPSFFNLFFSSCSWCSEGSLRFDKIKFSFVGCLSVPLEGPRFSIEPKLCTHLPWCKTQILSRAFLVGGIGATRGSLL